MMGHSGASGTETGKAVTAPMAETTCKIEGCEDPAAGRGWCSMHYQRFQANGDPLVVKRRAKQAPVCERDDCDAPGFMRGFCLPHYREVQRAERGPCSVEGCDEPWAARKLCVVHYHRFLRTGSTDDPKAVGRPCSVDGCSERARAREMCGRHYRNWGRYGTPEPPPKSKRVLRACIAEGCEDLGTRRNGMCDTHYRARLADGKPRCQMPGCLSLADREGFCERHSGWPRQLFQKYGITGEQYDAMLEAQGGRCAICQRPPAIGKRIGRLVVDHDHACTTRFCCDPRPEADA